MILTHNKGPAVQEWRDRIEKHEQMLQDARDGVRKENQSIIAKWAKKLAKAMLKGQTTKKPVRKMLLLRAPYVNPSRQFKKIVRKQMGI